MGAVSPAVVVPSMINTREKGLGLDKGIPTLVMASASVDDVLAICAYSVLLSVAVSTDGSGKEELQPNVLHVNLPFASLLLHVHVRSS